MSAREPRNEHDPLGKIYRQLEKLRGASARGEDVGHVIQELERSAGDIVRQREEQERDGR